MAIIFRCSNCKDVLLFSKKKYISGKVLCAKCFSMSLKKQEEENVRLQKMQEEEIKKRKIQIEKAKLRNIIADNKLKEELKEEQLKREEKLLRKSIKAKLLEEKKREKINNFIRDSGKNKSDMQNNRRKNDEFTKDEIISNKKLLLINAGIKRLSVIEWSDGKKRVILNKKREIRRTHAGGFSAEKFQKFVDFKKEKTFEWISNQMEKQNLLKPPYEKIKVVCEIPDLKDKLEDLVKSLKK